MKKDFILIKPHHFLDYLYDLAVNNRHNEPNLSGNANGELCRAFMDGKLHRISFTPFIDDICRPCNQLDAKNKCIQFFDDETTKAYGTRYKQDFNYQLDIKLNKALPDIFIFDKERTMIDVLEMLKSKLTSEIINLYLWQRPDRIKNTFIGIEKAIEIYKQK